MPGSVVAEQFEREPGLPGVIVTEQSVLIGMISRQRFLEQMSRRFSREVYLRRPIQILLSSIPIQPLRLPDTCRIDQAARLALQRSSEAVYEPIVVHFRDGSLRLIDFHILLLAQSHVLNLVNQMVQHQQAELRAYLQELRQERARVEQSNQMLQSNQMVLQEQQQLLQRNQQELVQRSEEVNNLNQKFARIGQILSVEGKKVFSATIEAIREVSRGTDDMINLAKALVRDLEAVQDSSNLIKRVGKQSQHLALQAAILANQFGSEFESVGRITSDIGQLSSQTFETGQRMDETAHRLKGRINSLTGKAREGAATVQALLEKVARAEVALAELEALLLRQENQTHQADPIEDGTVESLMQRVEQAGKAILELERVSSRGNSSLLVEKIGRLLKAREGSISRQEMGI